MALRKEMKLFNIPIKTIEWWERILLIFCPTYITADVTPKGTTFCKSKKLFGKLYCIKIWEEENKINGLRPDYFRIQEAIDKECG